MAVPALTTRQAVNHRAQFVTLARRSDLTVSQYYGVALIGIIVAAVALIICLHYTIGVWRWHEAFRVQSEARRRPISQSTMPPVTRGTHPNSLASVYLDGAPPADITGAHLHVNATTSDYVWHWSPERQRVGGGRGTHPEIETSRPNTPDSDFQSKSTPQGSSELSHIVEERAGTRPIQSSPPALRPEINSRILPNIDALSVRSYSTDPDSLLPPEYQSAWGGVTN